MPTIAQFYGIIIRMFYNDHAPPHFHASYGQYELIVGIQPITILTGHAPQRVRSMVLEWAALHQSELLADWQRCRNADCPLGITQESRMLYRIHHVTPHTDGRLHLTYADGTTVEIDFTPLIQRGGVYAPLADPALFAQVTLGAGGRFITWPGGLAFCADALWRQGHGLALEDSPAAVVEG